MGIVDNFKETAKLVQQLGNMDLYRRILDLQGEAMELTEQLRTKDEEIRVLQAYSNGQTIPGFKELGVTPESYILGIGDVVGEIRRIALDNIRKGNVENASDYLEHMETLYGFLMQFNYPSGLVAVRRKQDIARGILEKTRGDVTMALRSHSLEKMLDNKERD